MRKTLRMILLFLAVAVANAEESAPEKLAIRTTFLGDGDGGVVTRVELNFKIPSDVPPGIPLVVQGSVLGSSGLVRNFRYPLRPDRPGELRFVQTLPYGEVELEVRIMIPLEEETPVIVAKKSVTVTVVKQGRPYVAAESEGAEGVLAEGAPSEESGAVRIVAPKRDLAMNLFQVKVETKDPVKRVEFHVDGKKIFTRNAPPFEAELDLGKLPKRVEVRAVGYDAKGRYVDADAWVVNERDSQLELKITRTVTKDGIDHIKLSLQNPTSRRIMGVVLFVGDKKLKEWASPPYSIDLPSATLKGVPFIRASATDDSGYEASDLLFLDGSRFSESIEINLVELPVSVTDAEGTPVTDLRKEEFEVFEKGKAQKIDSFGFASNLPISVGLIVDHSGSMKERITTARDAALTFIQKTMREGDQAFFGGFSWQTTNVSPFVSNASMLRSHVASMPKPEGGTALYDAILTGLYRFRSIPGRKALIMITDGEDTASRVDYTEMLTYARAARVPVYFIGIDISMMNVGASTKMKAIAAETGASVWFVRDTGALPETFARLERELRSQYLIGYHAESTKKEADYRAVEVRTKRSSLKVRTIRGYIP